MNSHLSHGFCRSCLLFLPRDVSSASCRIATVRGKKPVTNDCVFRSVTKEEKEKENTRKVAPVTAAMTMPPAGRPSSVQARPIHGILQDDSKAVCGSFQFQLLTASSVSFDSTWYLLHTLSNRTRKELLLAQEKISWSAIIWIVLLAWVSVLKSIPKRGENFVKSFFLCFFLSSCVTTQAMVHCFPLQREKSWSP